MKRIGAVAAILYFVSTGFSFSQPTARISVEAGAGKITAGSSVPMTVTFLFPEGTHQTKESDLFSLSIETGDDSGFRLEEIRFPNGTILDGMEVYKGKTIVEAQLVVPEGTPDGVYEIPVRASYQLCDDEGTCFFPRSETVPFVLAVEEGDATSILLILLLSFLGGIILNVMPCVLPVLSIKAMSIVKTGGEDKRKILLSSLFYTAGIIVSFAILAIVVIVLKAAGTMVGWGFQFQNSGFVLALYTILILFALSLFDLFTIQSPFTTRAAMMGKSGGYAGSFVTGMFAVLLATPCTAPVLGSALGFAFASSAPVIILSFLFIGLGLALPFILIGFWPRLVRAIPKPGAWMNHFKTAMGFLILVTGAWLFDILVRQWGPSVLLSLLAYTIILSVFSWLYGIFGSPIRGTGTRTAALILFIACVVSAGVLLHQRAEVPRPKTGRDTAEFRERLSDMADMASGPWNDSPGRNGAGYLEEGWETFDPVLVELYRMERKPVFVIFSASWCLTCKTNETAVLKTREIDELFEENDVAVLYGDYTNEDPVIGSWIRDAGRAGVPVYLWYPVDAGEPLLLPEILTKPLLYRTITGR